MTADEKGWIGEDLAREKQQKVGHGSDSILQGLASGRVWHLVSVYLGMMFGLHILSSWAPQLVKTLSAQYSNSVIGLLLIVPNVIGLVAMILISRSSDRLLERRYHVAIPAVVAGMALFLLGTAPSPMLSIALLCLLEVGVYSYLGPFWALPNEFLTGYSAAAGIALINCVGNLGGFLGPATVGYFAHHTGRLFAGLAIAAVPVFASAILVLLLPTKRVVLTKAHR